MKTVLIASQQFTFGDPAYLSSCLGVLTLSAALKARGLDCVVPDLYEYNHLGDRGWEEILGQLEEELMAFAPEILGISNMTNNLHLVLGLCARLKEREDCPFIMLGGSGSSGCAVEIMKAYPQVDAIIRGEADIAFPDFVEAFLRGDRFPVIPGLVIRRGDEILDQGWPEPVMDMDSLPMPDYEACKAVPAPEVNFGDYSGISVEVGRGCPYNCVFCSTSRFFHRKYRVKSPERIVQEIEHVYRILGRNRIIFNHDLLTYNQEHVAHLCEAIRRHLPGLRWKCHTRLDTITPELVEAMAAAGCNEVFIGIETGSSRMQKVIHKGLNLEKFSPTIKLLKRNRVRFSLSFIVGFPEERYEDIEALFRLVYEAKALCGEDVIVKVNTLAPLTGSDMIKKYGEYMAFDLYGAIGSLDSPLHWAPVWEMVQAHPEIFTLYYHYKVNGGTREKDVKYNLLGMAFEKYLTRTLIFTVRMIGDSFFPFVLKLLESLTLPPRESTFDSVYFHFSHALVAAIKTELEARGGVWQPVVSLGELELATLKILRDRSGVQIFNAYYPPEEILAFSHQNSPPGPPWERERKIMVSWNSGTASIDYMTVPRQMESLLGG